MSVIPENNKFHKGNGEDGKHYWLTPSDLYERMDLEFDFDFDPCPYPKPEDFDGLTSEWGKSNYVNPPFGSIMHQGPNDKKPKKKGPTAWARKCVEEMEKGNKSVMVFPLDKWVLLLIEKCSEIRNLGDVKWLATEDKTEGKGLGRHIGMFILDPTAKTKKDLELEIESLQAENKKLRETLEFYADSENWCQLVNGRYNIGKIWVYQDPDNKYMNNSITLECGALAKKTLKEIDEGGGK